MANIHITRPQGRIQIQGDANARYVFEFPVAGAEFSRAGQDLAIRLEDGGSVEIRGFYAAKGRGRPSFVMEDREIDAKEFFDSMGKPDLSPAAGPGQSSSASAGRGHFHDYGTADAMEGLDHLGTLDGGSDSGALSRPDAMGLFRNGPDDLALEDEQDHFDMGGFSLEVLEGDSRVQSGRIPVGFQNPVSIEINGQAIPVAGTTELEFAGGILTITPNNGWLDYTYENKGPIRHENGEDAHFELKVTATDQNGKTSSAILDVVVRDDSPEISGRFDYDIDELSPDALHGNVLEGSRPSADGPNRLVFDGNDAKYGEFIHDENTGEWSYRINPKNPDIEKLGEGETLTEEIHYRYIDADGSTAEGKIVITINGQPDAIRLSAVDPSGENDYGSGILIVRESALDEGSAPGAAKTATGAIGIDALVEIESISVAGRDIPLNGSASLEVDGGILTVRHGDGMLRYEYRLESPFAQEGDGTDLSFPVVINGVGGYSASGDIRVHVTDDEPVIDGNIRFSIYEDNFEAISGNILDGAHPGADGAVLSWTSTEAEHGFFRDLGDGLWDYVLDPDFGGKLAKGETFTEVFEYSYRDADGDEKTGRLAITITGKDDGVSFERGHGGDDDDPLNPGEDGDGVMTVHEAGLPDGTRTGLVNGMAHGEAGIKAPDGIEHIRVGDTDVPLDGTSAEIALAHGTLLVSWNRETGKLDWTYTLERPADNSDGDVFDETEIFVKNRGGEGAFLPIKVRIADDEPGNLDIRLETDENGGVISGNISSTGNVGADGLKSAELTGEPEWRLPDGRDLGRLELDPDGSYRFVPGTDIESLLEGEKLTHEWIVRVTDGDGDEKDARITIDLSGRDSGVDINGDLSFPVEENRKGSAVIEITSPDGIDRIVVGGKPIDPENPDSRAEIEVPGGKITASYEDGRLKLEYEPDGPYDHGDADEAGIRIPVVVTNRSGGSVETGFDFTLIDGKPSVGDIDAIDVSPDHPAVSGKLPIDPGPDAGGHLEWGETDTPYGRLTPDPDDEGGWKFDLDPDSDAVKGLKEGETREIGIPFKYIDGDGDEIDGTLTIRVTGKDDGVSFSSSTTLGDITGMNVSEKGLSGGNGEGELSASGFLAMDAPDGVNGVKIDEQDLVFGKTAVIGVDGGNLSVTWTASGLAYSFVLTNASASLGHDFKIEVDTGGKETHFHTLRLGIEDDGPVIGKIDHLEIMSDASHVAGGNVLSHASAGADGPGAFSWNMGAGVHELEYGRLELFDDGSWKFAVNPEKGAELHKNEVVSRKIGFTWTDADGTSVSEDLEIAVKGAGRGVRLSPFDENGNPVDPVVSASESEWFDTGGSGSKGQLRIEHEDGDLSKITINGVDIPLGGGEATIPLGYGTLKAEFGNDVLEWEFALSGNVDKTDFSPNPIVITVTDAYGSSQSLEYGTRIEDDGPATPGTANGTIIETGNSVSGQVDFNFRADGPAENPVKIIERPENARGTLEIGPDGKWTYAFRDGDHYVGPEGATERFVYEITDGDGDTARGEIVIKITDDDGSGPGGGQGFNPFANDPAGGRFALSDTETGKTATKDIALPEHHESFGDVIIDGSAVSGLGAGFDWRLSEDGHVLTGSQDGVDKLRLTVSQDGDGWKLSAVLLSPVSHAADADLASLSNIPLVAVDAHGTQVRSDPSALNVSVADSLPSGEDISVEIAEGNTGEISGNLAEGSADAPNTVQAGSLPDGWELRGNELYHGEDHVGQLVIRSNGKWSFRLDPDFDITGDLEALRVPVSITDADGDTANAGLVLDWKADTNRPVVTRPSSDGTDPDPGAGGGDGFIEVKNGENIDIAVRESALANGTHPDAASLTHSGTMNIAFGGEDGSIRIGEKSVDVVNGRIVGASGSPVDEASLICSLAGGEGNVRLTLSMNSDGTVKLDYEFTLQNPMNHSESGGYSPIPVVITDATHDRLSFGLQVVIEDDKPELIRTDPVELFETNASAPFDITQWIRWGADGPGSIDSANGRYGHLEQAADGKWKYVLNEENMLNGVANIPEEGLTDTVVIRGKDGDGSDIEISLDIHVNDVKPDFSGLGDGGLKVSLDERDRTSDVSGQGAKPAGPHPVTKVVIDSENVEISGMDMTGMTKELTPDGKLVITAGNGTVITIEAVDENGWRLKASFEGPLPHSGDEDIVISGISLKVEDASGSTRIIDGGSVDIADSAPVTSGDAQSYTEGRPPVAGQLHDDFGREESGHHYELDPDQNGQGRYGKLTLSPDGSYTYVYDAGGDLPADGDRDVIEYWAVDSDGSRTKGEIVINIQTNGPKSVEGAKLDITLDESGPDRLVMTNEARLFAFDDEEAGAKITSVEFSDKYGTPELSGFTFKLSADKSQWIGAHENGSKLILTVSDIDHNGSISVKAVLEGNVVHEDGDLARVGNISIKATDNNGRSNIASGVVSIDIHDVAPIENSSLMDLATIDELIDAGLFIDELTEGPDGRYAPGEKTFDLKDFVDFGVDANGARFSIGSGDTVVGRYGVFHLGENGMLTYVRNDEHIGEDALEDAITVKYRDADNDEGSFTFNLAVKNTPPQGIGTVMGEMRDEWTRGTGLVDESGANMKNQYIYLGTLDHLKDNVENAVEKNGQLYYEETDAAGGTSLVAMQTTQNIFTETWLNNYSTAKGALRFSLPTDENGERDSRIHTNYEDLAGDGYQSAANKYLAGHWSLSSNGQVLENAYVKLEIVESYEDGSLVVRMFNKLALTHYENEPLYFKNIGFEWVDKDGTLIKVGDCSLKVLDDGYQLQDGLVFSAVQGKTIGSGTNEDEAYFITVSLPDDQYSADAKTGTSTWQLYDNEGNAIPKDGRLPGEYGYFTIRASGNNTEGQIYYHFYDNTPVPDGAVERFNYGVTDPDGTKSNIVYGVLKVFGNKVVGSDNGFIIDETSTDVVSPAKVQVFNPDTLVRDEENGQLVIDQIPDGKGGYIQVSSHWSAAPDINPASVRFAEGTNTVVGEHFFGGIESVVSRDGKTLTITDKNTGGRIVIVIKNAYADGTVDFDITTEGIMATGYDYENDHSYTNVILSNIKLEASLGAGSDAVKVVNSAVSLTVNDNLYGYDHFDDTIGLTSNTSKFSGTSPKSDTGLIDGDLMDRLDTHRFMQQFKILDHIGDDARAELLLDEYGEWHLANHLTLNDSSDRFGVETWIIQGTGLHVDLDYTAMNGSGELSSGGYHDFYVNRNGYGISGKITSASSDKVAFDVDHLSDGWTLEGDKLSYNGELVGELTLNPNGTRQFQLVFDRDFDFSGELGDLSIAYTITRDSGKGEVTNGSLDFQFDHSNFIYKFEANIDSGNRYAGKLAESMAMQASETGDDALVDETDNQDMLDEPVETMDDLIGPAGNSPVQTAGATDPVFSEMLASEQDAADTVARELANGNH